MNRPYFFNPRDLASIFFKHKVKIAIAFAATVLTVLVGTLLMTPVYQATSRILVKFGREYAYRPEVGGSVSNPYRPTLAEMLNGEIQILTSPDLAEKTINKVGIKELYPNLPQDSELTPMEMAEQNFSDSLSVKGMEESGVIEVAFQHTSPQMAAKVISVMLDLFKEKHLETFTDPNTSIFLSGKAQDFNRQLSDSQRKLSALKSQHSAYSLDEQRSLLLRQRSDLDSEYKSVQDKIAEARQRLASLQSQKSGVMSTARNAATDRDRTLDDTRSKLLDLQLKEQQLLQKYTDNSGPVTQIRADIESVEKFLKEQESEVREKATYANPIYQDLERSLMTATAELRSQQARDSVLKGQIKEIDAALKNLSAPENELKSLEMQVQNEQESYKMISSKLEEARIMEDMNRLKMTNISVIQPPTAPSTPLKPRKKINLMIGIALGVFLGLGLALAAEYLSQEVSSPVQIEQRLGVPVLATIPYLHKQLARPEA